MDKDRLTNKYNKENNNIINKLNSDNNIQKKRSSKIEHSRRPEIKDAEESKKHIKDMYDFADKNEFKSNVTFLVIGIVIAVLIMVFILMNTVFMKTKTAAVPKKSVTNITVDTPAPKIETIKPTQTKIYEYLNIEGNRTSLLKKAVDLNKGSQKGVTIYLLAEVLRLNDIVIPASTSSVQQLMKDLTSMEWKKNTDFTQLQKGDVCFTTDMPEKPGVPSHSYIFMGWVEEGKTDYAYICDGQVEEFGDTLHKRNISITTTQKDKFSFFLRK
jgi:uncharacterized integral membrane protein